MSLGSLAGLTAASATSLSVMVWLVLLDENSPSAKRTSSGATFSTWAAIAVAFTLILSVACRTAAPPIVPEREPPVPSPKNT